MSIISRIQYYLLITLGFVIIGATSALSGGIEYGNFDSAAYYVDLVLTYLAIISVISGIMIKKVMDFKEKDEEYLEGEVYLKEFSENSYRPMAFKKFTNIVNRKRKINQHKFNVQKAITKMDYPSWWRRLFHVKKVTEGMKLWETPLLESMDEEEQKELVLKKERDPYCMKRKELEGQLDPKWIEEHIDTLNVDYDRINASIILSGYYNKKDNQSPNDFITKNKSRKVVRDRGPLLLLGFGITAFVGSLAAQFALDGDMVLNTMTKSLVLLYQMVLTARYANDYNEMVTRHDLRFRKSTGKEFETWVQGQVSEAEMRRKEEEKLKSLRENKKKETIEKEEAEENGNKHLELNPAES